MKRFFYVITAVFFLVFFVVGFSACNKKKNITCDLNSNISYAETHKYIGAADDFRVSVTVGIREKLFIADGVAKDVADFARISVIPLKTSLLNKTFSYVLKGEGCELTGNL